MVAQEQRRLRSFIARLNPRGRRVVDHETGLRARLTDLVDRLQGQWRARVELKVGDDVEFAVSPSLVDDLYHIVHEAAANAARHGDAAAVQVELFREVDTVHVIVSDDGRGFSFHGDFDHARLAAAGLGPRSLMDRAAALGGSLSIHSSDLGARVDIALPLTRRES
jgi:signal transduction histidine kinase